MKRKNEFSATEVMALFESLRSDIRVVAESFTGLRSKIDALFEMVARNSEDIEMIKLHLQIVQRDIAQINTRDPEEKHEVEMIQKRLGLLEKKFRTA